MSKHSLDKALVTELARRITVAIQGVRTGEAHVALCNVLGWVISTAADPAMALSGAIPTIAEAAGLACEQVVVDAENEEEEHVERSKPIN